VETPEPTPVSSQRSEDKVPGAPEKKKRRLIPWSKAGIEKFGAVVGTAVESDEETVSDGGDGFPDDGWRHGQTRGVFVADSVEGESDSEDDCSSFVVDDDSESVVNELEKSGKDLGRTALEEVRESLVETEERLKRKLRRVHRKLARLDEQLSKGSGFVSDSEESEDAYESCESCYPWQKDCRVNGECINSNSIF
jgi:hypothetical protein